MKYVMFTQRFHAALRDGTKTQTIRRDLRLAVGESLALRAWSGRPYRSKQLDVIPPVTLSAVLPVRIMAYIDGLQVIVGTGARLEGADLDAFARRDGFTDWPAMWAYYRLGPSRQGLRWLYSWAERDVEGGGA